MTIKEHFELPAIHRHRLIGIQSGYGLLASVLQLQGNFFSKLSQKKENLHATQTKDNTVL